MFTKIIIQFTSRVSFPLIKKPDSFAENKENAKEMKLKTTLCWMLVTLLLLSFAQAEELPAVRVGDVSYSPEVVRFSYQSALDYYAAMGIELSQADREQLAADTIDHFIGLGLIENKLREAGQDIITEEQTQSLRAYAQNLYESVWQGLYQELTASGEEVSEAQVSQWLEEQGYTVDAYYQEALASERYRRILALYCGDVTVTPAQILQYYLDAFVSPDRLRYENDIPLYESEILLAGNEAFYTPEGYRRIKHILLAYPQEITEALEQIDARVQQAQAVKDEAYDALAMAAADVLDITPYKAAYDEADANVTALLEEYGAKSQEAVPALAEKTQEIAARLEQGESFEALMAEYSIDSTHQDVQDPGFLFHLQSENWSEAFRAAAAALEQPGDVSGPLLTTAGVHIIKYMSDEPGGAHVLTEEENAALENSALEAAQLEKLESLMQAWRSDYEIVTDSSVLSSDE